MNKLISLLLISSQAFAGLPPTTIQGQSDSSAKTKFGFQVPHNQSTDLGGIKALIETGNTNILKNPGFEGGSTGWTLSGLGSFTVDATAKGSGALGLNSSITTGGTTIKSDLVTIPNGYLGKNGVVSCDIKQASGTASRYLYVGDGTNPISTPTLINVNTNNFTENKINFIFPSSGSIQIVYEVVSGSGNQYIDDCKISLADNIGSVSQSILFGSIKYTAGSALSWTNATNAFANYAANASLNTPTVTGKCTAPGTKLPSCTFSSMPVGDYYIVSTGRFQNVGGTNAIYRFSDGTNSTSGQLVGGASASATTTVSGRLSYTSPQSNITLQIQGKNGGAGSGDIQLNTDVDYEMSVYYFPSASQQAVSSAQADYDWTAYTPTFTGLGTVIGVECFHARFDSDLKIRCKYVVGTGTGVEARVSLPNSLTSADTTKIPTIQNVGSVGFSGTGQNGNMLIEPSVTYLTYALTGTNALSKALGTSFSSSLTHSFYASIPIQGWSSNQRAPTLVGSVTSNSTLARRFESVAFGGASEPSNCTSNPCTIYRSSSSDITVGWTSAGIYTVTFANPFSVKPTCIVSSNQGAGVFAGQTSVTTSVVTLNSKNSGGTLTNDSLNVICDGPR